MIASCKGVAPINKSNVYDYISGEVENHVYHCYDISEGIWKTEFYMLTRKRQSIKVQLSIKSVLKGISMKDLVYKNYNIGKHIHVLPSLYRFNKTYDNSSYELIY